MAISARTRASPCPQDASVRSAELCPDDGNYCTSICTAALQALWDSEDVRDRLVAAGYDDSDAEAVAAAEDALGMPGVTGSDAKAAHNAAAERRSSSSSSGSSSGRSGKGRDEDAGGVAGSAGGRSAGLTSHPLQLRSKARSARSSEARGGGGGGGTGSAAASVGGTSAGGGGRSLRTTVSFAQGSVSLAAGSHLQVTEGVSGRPSGTLAVVMRELNCLMAPCW